jgi:hypothetical protein
VESRKSDGMSFGKKKKKKDIEFYKCSLTFFFH